MGLTDEQKKKLDRAEEVLGYHFSNSNYLLSSITHPSAVEGKPVKYSYERLEFLGDSILGSIVANAAFHRYPEIDEGGLTRIKVSLVSGATLSRVAEKLGYGDFIIFGLSERGTGKRGLHSALENVYEATVAALFLDGGIEVARRFVDTTLVTQMDLDMAREPENPKSVLQERLQEDGITPTYKLIETQGPPHDRTFVTQVFAGVKALARGVGRTKKESESKAAQTALQSMSSRLFDREPSSSAEANAKAKKKKTSQRAQAKAERAVVKQEKAQEKARAKALRKSKKDAARDRQR